MRSSVVFRVLVLLVVATVLGSVLCAQGWVDRTPVVGPAPRYGHSMCWDPVRNYVLLVGGQIGALGTTDTWSWDGNNWTSRGGSPSASPPWNGLSAAVTHSSTGEVLFMKSPAFNGSPQPATCHRWDGGAWQLLPPVPSSGLPLGDQWGPLGNWQKIAAAFDPVRGESVFFSFGMTSVVVWDGTSFFARPLTSNINLAYAISGQSYYFSDSPFMAWDPVSQRIMLTYRGWSALWVMGAPVWFPLTRVYEYNGSGFVQRNPADYPARPGAMATDTTRNRIVMFDGEWDVGSHAALPKHTWLVANGAMTRLETLYEPSFREQSAMAFDPVRGVCVLFGGLTWGSAAFGDTWEFDLGPLASFTPYGTGCIGSRGIPTLAAQAGSLPRVGATFTTTIGNLPWSGPAVMLLGLSNTTYGGSPLPLDLAFVGAPSCFLRTSIDDIQPVTNVLGAATWSWTIPPFPGASFYTQVLPVDPSANTLGITLSNAGHAVIGL